MLIGRYKELPRQNSPQTLAEGIREYSAANPGLANVRTISPEAQPFFRCHGTALDDEAVVKIASILGTTAGPHVLKGYRAHATTCGQLPR
jgi:hypothetical protein